MSTLFKQESPRVAESCSPPPEKLTLSYLKMDGWDISFILGPAWPISRGFCCYLGCVLFLVHQPFFVCDVSWETFITQHLHPRKLT